MFQRDSPWEEYAFTRTWTILDKSTFVVVICLGFGVIFGLCYGLPVSWWPLSSHYLVSNARHQLQRPTDQERVNRPFAIQHPKICFQTLQSCGMLTFLAHPTNGDKCSGFEKTEDSRPKVILNPQGTSKVWVLKKIPNRHCFAVFPTLTILTVVTCLMNVWN